MLLIQKLRLPVLVKTFPCLSAKPAHQHHFLEFDRKCELRILVLFIEAFHNGVLCLEADEVDHFKTNFQSAGV